MTKRQSMEQVQEQQFDQRMRALVEQRVSPSLAVIAVQSDDTVVARGYGWSDLEQKTKASAETIYLYCSMTKLFTATALMQLHERGLVELDREVRAYLPDFPLRHPSGREVTVRHLLTHSSGIANPVPVSWVHLAEEPVVNLDDFTKRLLARYHRLRFEPDSRYAYSNLGYLVLGQVIERMSGQSYTDYIQQPMPACNASHTVLLTNLANRVQPIIRYDLGDHVLVRPDPCPCGSPFPATRVEGRRDDSMYMPAADGRKVPVPPHSSLPLWLRKRLAYAASRSSRSIPQHCASVLRRRWARTGPAPGRSFTPACTDTWWRKECPLSKWSWTWKVHSATL